MTTTVQVTNLSKEKKVGIFFNNPQTDKPSVTLEPEKTTVVDIYPGKEAFLKEL